MTARLRSIFAALLLLLASAAAAEAGRYRVRLNLAAHDDLAQVARQIEAITRGRIESSLEAGESTFILAASDSAVKILATCPSVAHVEAIDSATPHASPATWTTGTYAYDGSGNIKSITRSNFTERYVYDAFGRLTSGSVASGRSQAYTYDRFGNILSITTDSGSAVNLGVNSKNNRMEATGPSYNITATYDGAGRLKTVPSLGYSFIYDGIDTLAESTVAGERKVYLYTASDERVASVSIVNGASATWDWTIRDPEAKILRRFTRAPGGPLTWTEDYVYRGSQMLAAEVASVERRRHFYPDHLGTSRVITGNGGTQVGLHTYYPFGVEITSQAQEGERKKFTGHERDNSATDYLHARYYSPAWGRFLSVDPFLDVKMNSASPQRWNRYTYVTNNPINKTDPDGKDEYVLTWKATAKSAGHTAVAVQNRDASGNPTGSLTVRDLWPSGEVNKNNLSRPAVYGSQVIPQSDLASYKNQMHRPADGIVRIAGGAKQDADFSAALSASAKANPNYVVPSVICSTYAAAGTAAVGLRPTQTGVVTVWGGPGNVFNLASEAGVLTPVALHNSLANSNDPRVQVIKKPDETNPNIDIKR
jgi:RHS repeat-associated protein